MRVSRDHLVVTASMTFRRFYRKHGRNFPWREKSTTPFGILVAEMLLRQTKAEQAAAVWPTLLDLYPDPRAMSAADSASLHDLLAPLGLGAQRVHALQEMSVALVQRHRGHVPRSPKRLADLPHVGLYAANATACFAFGQRVPVVDVNVLRVLGRVFGETFKPDNRRVPEAWQLAGEIMPANGPAKEHNYGLLDFAALICTPNKPLCRKCPINSECAWCREHVWSKTDLSQRPPSPPWPR